jgi:hypothetical protein
MTRIWSRLTTAVLAAAAVVLMFAPLVHYRA